MEFDNPYGTLRDKRIVTNDFEDFQMPYETASEIDQEIMRWKYSRLNNLPQHLYQIKVGRNIIFGKGF